MPAASRRADSTVPVMAAAETIFALSSGQPPAAIAVIRISGAEAGRALEQLAGSLPAPRHASLRNLIDPRTGAPLDRALVLWFPGPASVTGENLAELHLHGGRAVVRAVKEALRGLDGLREAEPGEFTRRAFENGRLDLTEAEGLSDLLFAETEMQRRAAIMQAEGGLSRLAEDLREGILDLAARVEALLDFSDEDDVAGDDTLAGEILATADRIAAMLAAPSAEKLRDGVRVVLAGPPNSGKSTLLNALVAREAAITSDQPGTTRDLIEASVAFEGIPFTFIDTAGLREQSADAIEEIGMARARNAVHGADLVLWLGEEGRGPEHPLLWEIEARADRDDRIVKAAPRLRLSALTGQNLDALVHGLCDAARDMLPRPDQLALNERQRSHLSACLVALREAAEVHDELLRGEQLRLARQALDALTGRSGTEDMLDALFGRFCIGK